MSIVAFRTDNHPDREADRPELTVPFDEQEFLQGKIPVLGGEARPRDPVGKLFSIWIK